MQAGTIRRALYTVGAVVLALPAGYLLGVTIALAVSRGGDFGQLPAFTVPLSLFVTFGIAIPPILAARTKFLVMLALLIIGLAVTLAFHVFAPLDSGLK